MDKQELLSICLSLKGAYEDFPFGAEVSVLKVMNKMFALIPLDEQASISLKGDPIESEMLRATYSQITPGYHLNKKHWNTLVVDDDLPRELVIGLISDSYDLVVKSLKKAERQQLNPLNEAPDD